MALCASTVWLCWHVLLFDVVEVSMRPDVLRDADEVLICNALMPLVPVCRWDDVCWSERDLYHFFSPIV